MSVVNHYQAQTNHTQTTNVEKLAAASQASPTSCNIFQLQVTKMSFVAMLLCSVFSWPLIIYNIVVVEEKVKVESNPTAAMFFISELDFGVNFILCLAMIPEFRKSFVGLFNRHLRCPLEYKGHQ